MPDGARTNLDRSAGHYLTGGVAAARLTRTLALAARTLGFPMGMVTILDSSTQHTITSIGMDAPPTRPRAGTVCDQVVRTGSVVAIDDATSGPRTHGRQTMLGGSSRSCLAVPLTGREAIVIGSLCLLDVKSRKISPEQVARLVDFGRIVDDQLDLMRRLRGHRDHGTAKTDDLAAAIAAGEIVPWYQPIIDLRTSETIGYEALARWQRPAGEVEMPDGFIPLAEDSEIIVDLDLAMFQAALRDVKAWQLVDPMARVSVNISGRSLDRAGWAEQLGAIAAEVGVAASTVFLEVTESARLTGDWAVDAAVAQLRRAGFGLLLDDFGTGWSSLEYVLRLPINGVKIDRVVAAALGTPVGDALVRSVTGLAQQLNLTTTIEGIETAEQAHLALGLGCDYGQGFHWSRAVPAAEIHAKLRDTVHRTRSFALVRTGSSGSSVAQAWPASPESSIAATSVGLGSVAMDVLDALPDATAVLDPSGTLVAVNRAWRIVAMDNGGGDDTSGVGRNYLDVCDDSAALGCPEAAEVAEQVRAVLDGRHVDAEIEYPCAIRGSTRWFLLRVSPVLPTGGAIVSHINITRRKLAEDEQAHAASHDPLTGLANRVLFESRLASALKARANAKSPSAVGVVFIDLNRFKSINDTLGHAAGDEVLLVSAQRLRDATRPGDTAARLGGDEFAVIAPRIDGAALADLGLRIQRALSEPQFLHGAAVVVHGSVGTHLAALGEDPVTALAQADAAMYTAKGGRPSPRR